MRVTIKGRSPIITGASAAILISSILSPAPANAAGTNFTAGVVMEKMDGVQRYTFIAGVVEGLAVARYMKDGKKPDGMNCIYDWFYDDKTTKETIYAALGKYSSYKPGAVVDVLAKQKCGE